jgi:FkbM family methyltransferase
LHKIKSKMKELIYKIIDIVLLKKGWKVNLSGMSFRLPIRYARFYQDGYEKDNFEFYKNAIDSSSTIIDIGGHIGLNTVFFAKLAPRGHVYVFEPAANTLEILKDTIRINSLSNVTIIPKIVSDKNESIKFYVNNLETADNANSIVKHRMDKDLKEVNILSTSLDAFMEEFKIDKVDFIKIDAEGGELKVLKGSEKLFKNNKPKMTLGLHPHPIKISGDSLYEIYDILISNKYNVSLNNNMMSKEDFCSQTDLFDVQLQ